MEQVLVEIYRYANTISILREIVDYTRVSDDLHAYRMLKEYLLDIQDVCNACIQDRYEEAETLKDVLLDIPNLQKDIILFGDVFENIVIPIMERWIQTRLEIHEQLTEEFMLESTACGFLTLKNLNSNLYFHSNNNPMEEARKIVMKQFDYTKSKYSIFGLGLGYHVYQLYRISKGTVPITIYENDSSMVEYALQFGVLGWIPKECYSIEIGYDAKGKFNSISTDEGILMHLPSIKSMEVERKNVLMSEYVNWTSAWDSLHDIKLNIYRNLDLKLPDISRFTELKQYDEVVIVAAGPSLDRSMDTIRNWKGKKAIVAVGTVYKKLRKNEIVPDLAAIMDPYESVYGQFKDVKDTDVPLMLGLTTFWKIAREYGGDKYTVCVGPEMSGIEDYAYRNGFEVWPSGGTVTALALEYAIRSGAKKIYLAGVDLAYPNQQSHCADTEFCHTVEESNLLQIKDVNGKNVSASHEFDLYRKWIEYRISQAKGIQFYNMSDCGARIEGTIRFSF